MDILHILLSPCSCLPYLSTFVYQRCLPLVYHVYRIRRTLAAIVLVALHQDATCFMMICFVNPSTPSMMSELPASPIGDQFTLPAHTPSHLRVAYIHSSRLQATADLLPSNIGRSSVVHNLIHALGLLDRAASRDTAGDGSLSNGAAGSEVELETMASVVQPDLELGDEVALRRYHDAAYVGSWLA
jgi:hypothetical protein